MKIWTEQDCAKYLPRPKETDHKYKRGVLCAITGSSKYPGAALLSTESALNIGIGMVRYIGPRQVKKLVIQNRPEIVLARGKFDALLMGCGISGGFQRARMRRMISSKVPKILDAGALDLVSRSGSLTIITPHSGELSKLLNCSTRQIEDDPEGYAAKAAAQFKVTVLLKGHETVISNSKELIRLPAASSYLATAGTGDVLAGIIGGLLALNRSSITELNLIEIAATAAFIHGKIAELDQPLSPSKMIDFLPSVIARLSK